MSSDDLAPPPYASPPKYSPTANPDEQPASTTASQVELAHLNGSDLFYPNPRPQQLPAEPAAAVTANPRNADPAVATRSLRTAAGGIEIAVAVHPSSIFPTPSSSWATIVESDDRRVPDLELTRMTMRLHGGDVELGNGVSAARPRQIEARPRVAAGRPRHYCRQCRDILELIGLVALGIGLAATVVGNIAFVATDVNDYNDADLTKELYAVRSVSRWKYNGVLLLCIGVAQLFNYILWWTEKDTERRKGCFCSVLLGLFCDCVLAVLFAVYWFLIGKWAEERGLI